MPDLSIVVHRTGATNEREIVIAPDGDVESKQGSFRIDAESFEEIDEAFREHGTELVIDYEHQTLGGKYAAPDGRAPAAGWIKSLRYEPGRGIVASVEWTETAQNHIKKGEYRYLSPVLAVRKSDGRAVRLHSVAVTNTPAIGHLEKLVAKEMGIMPETKTKTKKNGAGTTRQAHQDLDAGLGDPLLGLARIAEALGLEDVPNEAGALAEAILAAVRQMKGAGEGEGEGEGGEEMAAKQLATIAARLSIDGDADLNTVVAKIDEMRSKAIDPKEYAQLVARCDALESKEVERTVDAKLKQCVADGKLNPNDKDSMDWARKVCSESPENFDTLMSRAPKVWAGSQPATKHTHDQGNDDRKTLIARAASEFEKEQEPGCDKWAYVHAKLQIDGHEGLSAKERAALQDKEAA